MYNYSLFSDGAVDCDPPWKKGSCALGPISKRRSVFDEEHEAYRDSFRTFIARELQPHYAEFEDNGIVPRSVWTRAGAMGFLCPEVPEEFGGAGIGDFRFNAVLVEEINARSMRGFGISVHSDIVIPYLLRLGSQEQKKRWLPGMVAGQSIAAIAMTEPGAGSDLASIRTTARLEGTGPDAVYVVNGQKTFITNGQNADIVITAVRTGGDSHRGLTLLMLERGMPGFERGRKLDKIGIHAQDTSEMFFTDVRVPAANVLGDVDGGFGHLVDNLPRERLSIAIGAVAAAEHALALTIGYVKERAAFGATLADLQNTRFVLADLATQIRIMRVYVDDCLQRHLIDELDATEAAMVKLAATELQVHTADRCVQLHGAYGYMNETEVARMWRDSRPQTIYGGASEVMKHIIGRALVR